MNYGREDKNPWTKWYWQDWEADTGLRAASLAAQGLWMRMLSIMARSKRKGFLLDGENQMESKTLAKLTGESEDVIETLIAELRGHSVFSQDEDGTIFNRRMVRGSEISEIRAKAGRLGGRAKKQTGSKSKAEREQHAKANTKARSASVSASASVSSSEGEVQEREIEARFDEFWKAYPCEGRLAKKESQRKFGAIVKRGELKELIAGFHGYLDFLKQKRVEEKFEQRPMYAKTFLNDRWREFIGYEYKPRL